MCVALNSRLQCLMRLLSGERKAAFFLWFELITSLHCDEHKLVSGGFKSVDKMGNGAARALLIYSVDLLPVG